jgi:hypothetical protein
MGEWGRGTCSRGDKKLPAPYVTHGSFVEKVEVASSNYRVVGTPGVGVRPNERR